MLLTALQVASLVAIVILTIAYVGRIRAIARREDTLQQALDSLSKSTEQRAAAEQAAGKALEERIRDLTNKMNEADNHWRMAEERLKKKTAELELMANNIADHVNRATHLPEKMLAAVELVGRVFRQSFEAEQKTTGSTSPTTNVVPHDSAERSNSSTPPGPKQPG